MRIKITKADIIWSYLGYILRYGSNLLILPVILKQLDSRDLGLWYVFSSIGGLVLLVDFGFAPTIMRNITYAWSGARDIQKQGVAGMNSENFGPNYALLNQIMAASRRIYLCISMGALFMMVTAGTFYIYAVSSHMPGFRNIMLAWGIFAAGTFLNLYYSYWLPFLTGVGEIKSSQKAGIISQACYLVTAWICLGTGLGLAGISAAYVLCGIVLRFTAKKYFRNMKAMQAMEETYSRTVRFRDCRHLFRVIWHNAYKLGLVTVGSYFILQANTMICSGFFGLVTTASYGLSLQLFTAVGNLSAVLFRSYLPVFNEAQLHGDRASIKKYFSMAVMVSWFCFLSGGLAIAAVGGPLLQLIGSQTALLPVPFLWFMLLYSFLDFNNGSICAAFIMTKNEVPFVFPALISGFAVVTLSFLLAKHTNLGVWALGLSQFAVQTVYNNWKWPVVVLQELKMNLPGLASTGIKSLLAELKTQHAGGEIPRKQNKEVPLCRN